MPKLALFLAGMLVGSFLTAFIMLHQRDRKLELGPQGYTAQDNDEDWAPCEYLTKRRSGSRSIIAAASRSRSDLHERPEEH